MGICTSCCGGSEPAYTTPSEEERRQKMIEAAEKRQREQECRGLKDGIVAAQRIEKSRERSKQIDEALDKSSSDNPLRWQVT